MLYCLFGITFSRKKETKYKILVTGLTEGDRMGYKSNDCGIRNSLRHDRYPSEFDSDALSTLCRPCLRANFP